MSAPRAPSSEELQFELISDLPALERFASAWRELGAEAVCTELMQGPDWLLTWWRHYGARRTLACGVFRHRGLAVGFAPMCRRWYRYRMGLAFRRLELLGSGFDESDGVCSDYLGIAARRGFESAVSAAFARHLADGSFGAVDECLLEGIDASDPMASHLRADLSNGPLAFAETVQAKALYIKLPDCWETYEQSVRKKSRKFLRTAMRDFELWTGAGGYRLHRAIDAATLEAGRRALTSLHGARWRKSNSTGVFAASRFSNFHRDFAQKALATDALELLWLTVNDEPVAAIYCFVGSNKVYFYQSGRKVGVPPKVRLGIVMMVLAIQQAIAQKRTEFDFLAGDDRYKRLFATESRQLISFRVARKSAKETVRRILTATVASAKGRL